MALNLIKTAQTLNTIGDKIDLYKEVQTIIEGSTLESVSNILKENESFGITPQQIHDQVHQHLAPAAGKNGQALSQRQFNTLANQFRLELEDEYSEIYPTAEWKRLAARAWEIHQQAHLTGQENEEKTEHPYQAGWTAHGINQGRDACPHKAGTAEHKDWHEGYSDAYDAQHEENEEKGWPSTQSTPQDNYDHDGEYDDDNFGEPNADGSYGQRYEPLPHASDNFFGDEDEEQLSSTHNRAIALSNKLELGQGQINRIKSMSRVAVGKLANELEKRFAAYSEENEEMFHRVPEPHEKQSLYGPVGKEAPATDWYARDHGGETDKQKAQRAKIEDQIARSKLPQEPISLERQGWYDAQFDKPMTSQDPEYMKGYELYKRTGSKPWLKKEENEEDVKPTFLQSLLQQKKTAAKKANDALKDIESEGAKAFHEHRMAGEKSPYDPKKAASDHETWTRGWQKAAAEHYAPVVEPKAKKKSKK
jgi:hypothetical protein